MFSTEISLLLEPTTILARPRGTDESVAMDTGNPSNSEKIVTSLDPSKDTLVSKAHEKVTNEISTMQCKAFIVNVWVDVKSKNSERDVITYIPSM